MHKRTVVACVLTPERREVRTFGTLTGDLLELGDWPVAHRVGHIAMESPGVYWKPVYNLLEGLDLVLWVVNARQIKAVPGRKTDVKDAEWVADLLRHGLLRGSYIPDRAQRELQELGRYRRSLIQQRAQVINRIRKVLEGANVKLGTVASDVVGVSGRAMPEAIAAGTDDPQAPASLARGRLQEKRAELEAALRGLVGPHRRFLLRSQPRHLDSLREAVERLNVELAERMRPFADALRRLDTIPGVGRRTAEGLVAAPGTDMSRFRTARHLASWAHLCPGNDESAGKRKGGRTGPGNVWPRGALVEAAWAAARSRRTYLSAPYRRSAARRGAKRAPLAVAHSILVIVYHLLKDGTVYRERGGNHSDEHDREATTRRAVRRPERLGYKVTIEAA